MPYADIDRRLKAGGVVLLDGATGTELQRRGVAMDPGAWCGPASLENGDVLEAIHRDYIAAGADIITVNTYASSRLMLGPAGYGDQFEEINQVAVRSALRARAASGRDDVVVAGSLSHMSAMLPGTSQSDLSRAPSQAEMADAFAELATLLRDEGCELLLLEMMFRPDRQAAAFQAALDTGLPVWAGFSVRRGDDGKVLGFAQDVDIPFTDLLSVLKDFEVAAAGVMHSPANVTGDAIDQLRAVFDGPLIAYPDSGYFAMPDWRFEDIIPPDELLRFARDWVGKGVQVVGGCCGLSPQHIAALQPLKEQAAA